MFGSTLVQRKYEHLQCTIQRLLRSHGALKTLLHLVGRLSVLFDSVTVFDRLAFASSPTVANHMQHGRKLKSTFFFSRRT